MQTSRRRLRAPRHMLARERSSERRIDQEFLTRRLSPVDGDVGRIQGLGQ